MTQSDSANLSGRQIRQSLLQRLADFRRRVRAQMLVEGAARFLGLLVLLALATLVLDRALRLSAAARWMLLAAAATALAVTALRQIIVPLRLKLDPLTLASALGEGVVARVASVLDLPTLLDGTAPPSAAMVREAVMQSHIALATVDFGRRLDGRRQHKAWIALVGAMVLPALMWIVAPATVGLWAARLFLGSNQPWPQNTYLQVAGLNDGVLVVPRGEPFVLRVTARAGSVSPPQVTLRFREGDARAVQANLTAFGGNDFRYDFSGINAGVQAEVWGGDDVVGPFAIQPADRPRISDLQLITQHPTAASPTRYDFTAADSDLSFLPRTAMRLLFTANTPIAQARVVSAADQRVRQIDDRHFAIDWIHDRAVQLRIELVSRDAHLASVPTEVAIGLKTDQPPRVTMAYSGVHQRVTAVASIPLTVEARDDYGVAEVDLLTKAERSDPASAGQLVAQTGSIALYGPATRPTELQIQQTHRVELESLQLPAGSLLTVGAAATDACYTGAQTARSRQVTFRIVPAEELFREILLRQQAERAKFRRQTDEAQSIAVQLMSLGTSGTEAAHRHRAVEREVISITASLSESVTEMRLNRLATSEAYDMIEKNVLAPLKSLSGELLKAQKDALDVLNPADPAALADVRGRQDKIVAEMEEILKQMAQWDSFVDVLNQLNEVIRLQDQAQQTTNQLKKQQTEGIFEK